MDIYLPKTNTNYCECVIFDHMLLKLKLNGCNTFKIIWVNTTDYFYSCKANCVDLSNF